LVGTGITPSSTASTVPDPTWQVVVTMSAVSRQPPLSIAALASSPGGRFSVRAFGVSFPVGANFSVRPRLPVAPAVTAAVELEETDGVIAADAAEGAASTPRRTKPGSARR
jgi:hypothetical protein